MFHMQTIHFRKTDDFHLILLVCTVSFWILFQENTTHREVIFYYVLVHLYIIRIGADTH